MADIAAGFGIDFSKIDKELKAADKRLEVFAESAEKQMQRVRDAFELSGTKGLKQLQAELTNTYSKMSKLAEKNKIVFSPAINGVASQQVIDDINKIVNYTRTEWEKLNALRIGSKLIDPKIVNDVEALSTKLMTLQSAMSTGRLQSGNIDVKITDAMRVKIADEIAAIQERLKVLRMSTAEFQEMKSKEIQRVISNAQIEEDLAQKKKKQYEEELQALKKIEEEKARNESRNRANSYARTQRSGDTSSQALAAYNRLYSDKGVMSIQRMNEALSKLRSSQEKLNLNTEQGKKRYEELDKAIKRVEQDLNKATNSSKRLTNEQNALVEVGKKLTTRFAQLFSVQAIVGYANKVKSIRGEFEMQHKAMQTLIGDVDEANALWDKTISLSVKSPFKVRDLVTYTKQLSAYRIETDQLYNKTKMLADISAGLGVDMNRLILAYGQVKAANYLRGTELRQFSEAGINILQELSTYFSELEGRAVSVGDVFERVSKRLVSFADVDAVLQKVTSEGGAFYKMQEKQSETLQGMSMNLIDSIELMMNDLGKRNEDILKGSINILKTVIDNWRILEPAITAAGIALITYFPLKKIGNIGKALASIPAAFTKHPIAIIAAGLTAVAVAIYKIATAQSKLNEELNEIDTNISKSLREDIAAYHKLADTINDVTSSTEEYEKAKSQLKKRFSEILPDQELEVEYIKGLTGNYKAAEDAMFAYYNAKARAQKEDKIRQTYSEDIETNTEDLIKGYNRFINTYIHSGAIDNRLGQILLSSVSGAVNNALFSLESGEISSTELFSTINENISHFADFDFSGFIQKADMTSDAYMKINRNISQLKKNYADMNRELNKLEGLPTETYEEQVIGEQINAARKNIDETKSAYKSAVNVYAEYISNVENVGGVTEENLKNTNGKINDILNSITNEQYKTKLNTIFDTLWSKAQQGSFAFHEVLQQSESDLHNYLADVVLSDFQVTDTSSDVAKRLYMNFSQELGKEADKLKLNSFQKAVIEGAKGIAEDFGVDINLFSKFIPNSKEALSTVSQELEGYIKQWEDIIKKFDSSSSVEGYGVLAPDILSKTSDEIEKMKEAMPALNEFAKLLGIIFKDKSKKDPELFTKQLSAIRKLYEAYKDLMKTSTEAQSKEGAWEKVGDAWMAAFKKTPEQMGFTNFFSEEGVTEAFDWLVNHAPDAAKKVQAQLAKSEFILEGEVRVRQEDQEKVRKEIDDMLGNYEVSMEMEKLDIPPELASRLFDFTPTSFDEIREKVQSEIAKIEATGGQEDQLKAMKEYLERVDKLERDALKDRMKEYVKYLRNEQNERIKFKMEEIRKLSDIDKLQKAGTISSVEATQMRENVKKETHQNIEKSRWEEFEKSSTYVNMFEDTTLSTTAALQAMKTRLEEMKSSMIAAGLSASDLKEVLNQIVKVEDELDDRNLFGGIGEDIKNTVSGYKEYLANKREEAELLNAQKELGKRIAEQELLVEQEKQAGGADNEDGDLKARLASEEASLLLLEKGSSEYEDQLLLVEALRAELYPQLAIYNQLISQQEENNNQLDETQSGIKKWRTALSDVVEKFSEIGSSVLEIGSSLTDTLVKTGVMSEDTAEIVNNLMNAGNDILGIGTNLAGVISNPASLQSWAGLLTSTISLVGNLAATSDAVKDKEIAKEAKAVEKLSKKYEELSKEMDNAYSIEQMQVNQKAMEQNLDAQIAAIEKQRAAEEDKKNTDQDAVDEYTDKIKELEEKKAETQKELVEKMGGSYDYASIAEQFVDAWLAAFEETGDGLKGLEDNFEEFFKDIVKKQIIYGGVTKIIEPLMTLINSDLGDNQRIDDWTAILKEYDKAEENINTYMKDALDKLKDLGLDNIFSGESELSGLSAGISGITEDQADVLASYWNAVRFSANSIDDKLSAIMDNFLMSNDGSTNPICSELRKQTSLLTSIEGLLESVTGEYATKAVNIRT